MAAYADSGSDSARPAGPEAEAQAERQAPDCQDGRVTELWSLRPDVLITDQPGEPALRLHGRWGETVIRPASALVRDLLRRMQLGPTRLANALDSGRKPEPAAAADRAAVLSVLTRIQPLVARSLATSTGDLVLLSVEPIAASARFRPHVVAAGLPVRLSRFTVLRAADRCLQAESPLSLHRVLLHRDEAAAIASALARPRTLAELGAVLPTEERLLHAAVAYLIAAGVAVQAVDGPDGPVFAEDTDPVLRLWPADDLMFHTRSSLGRHDGPFGATFAHGDGHGPEPAVKPRPAGERIALFRPRFEHLLKTDAPFSAVLEARHSAPRLAAAGPDARELGELLYRAVRIRARTKPAGHDAESGGLLSRPYPAGGSLHELEFYVTVRDCAGLEPGVYAYDPLHHALCPVTGDPDARDRMLGRAQQATGLSEPPPVLVTITARFGRVLWKYSGLGYNLVLKDAGVAMLTLQLVATAMGLGTRPVGGAEIDEAPRLLGLDWRAESGVGGVVLGRVPGPGAGEPAEPGEPAGPIGQSIDPGFGFEAVNDADWRRIGQSLIKTL
jgi:SagB-type dehydrogenase family enzyme